MNDIFKTSAAGELMCSLICLENFLKKKAVSTGF